MKTMELLRRYANGAINRENSGLIEDLYYMTIESYVRMMFGQKAEILFGELVRGKNYVYAYEESEDCPEGFTEDDKVAMCVEDGNGCNIWIYEIED